MRRQAVRALATGAGALLPTAALAHGTLPGTGGFAAGLAHPFLATEHLMVLVALGLLLGPGGRLPIGLLVAGLAAGLGAVAPGWTPGAETLRWLTLALALAVGLAVALAEKVPPAVSAPVALLVGAVAGAGTDLPLAGPLAAALPAVAGVVAGVLLLTLNAMAFARCRIGRGPGRRIGGSWIAAAAVMLLAFFLHVTPGTA